MHGCRGLLVQDACCEGTDLVTSSWMKDRSEDHQSCVAGIWPCYSSHGHHSGYDVDPSVPLELRVDHEEVVHQLHPTSCEQLLLLGERCRAAARAYAQHCSRVWHLPAPASPLIRANVHELGLLRRTDRGQYKVYNMTLQGGHPLTQARPSHYAAGSSGSDVREGCAGEPYLHGHGYVQRSDRILELEASRGK